MKGRQWHSSNNNDYENSTIDNYLNTTFLNLFESNIRDAIKQVKIPYRKGAGYGKTVTSGSSGLSTKIFLLSSTEVNLVHGYEPTNEGAACCPISQAPLRMAPTTRELRSSTGRPPAGGLRSPYCNSRFRFGARVVRGLRWQLELQRLLQLVWHPAPLWYFPLLSLSLTTGRFRRTRLRLSAVRAATVG